MMMMIVAARAGGKFEPAGGKSGLARLAAPAAGICRGRGQCSMSSGGSGSDGEGGGGGGGGEVEEGGGGGGGCPVTAAWLEAVLAEHHGVSESDVSVEQLSARPGCDAADSVLSDILAVSVRYRLDQQPRHLHLIVKLLPQDPFSRYFVTEAQFDLREIKFYTKVVPDLHSLDASVALPIPQCYHARYTADVESVLVLDNLKERGYEGVDFSKGLTLAQAESALDAVARLHALGLAYKIREKVELDEHYPFLFQTARASDSYQQLVERGLPQLAAFLRAQPNTEHLLRSLNLIRPHTKHIIAALLAPQEPIALITHTDFWCNNLLFTPQDQCAVLDWQMVTYSRPTNDVALLLVSSLPTELRRTHTDQLLDHYWTAFTSTARRLRVDVDAQLGYDRRRLGADFRRSQLLALLLCIGSVDVALGDPLTEQRLIDVLHDLHDDGILSLDVLDLPNS